MITQANTFRTLIVDDESVARQTIRDLLAKDEEVEIVGECSNGLEMVNFFRNQTPDLLFLDIQMPGMTGFEALAEIEVDKIPAVIFVTAFGSYALQAFEVRAFDYLLKPFSDSRFEEAVRQVKTHLRLKEIGRLSRSLVPLLSANEAFSSKRRDTLRVFMIKSAGRAIFIKAEDVDWIAADNYYVQLHVSNKSYLHRISLNDLEENLDPAKFLRIHRSTIVNFDRVREMRRNDLNGDYEVILKDGTALRVSRSGRERLEQFLEQGA